MAHGNRVVVCLSSSDSDETQQQVGDDSFSDDDSESPQSSVSDFSDDDDSCDEEEDDDDISRDVDDDDGRDIDGNNEESINNKVIGLLKGGGDLKVLKLIECKSYLRENGLRISGTKAVCVQRILEHRRIKDGNVEALYPRSSFCINCTGDVCKGDTVLFTQKVCNKVDKVTGHKECAGKRTVAGKVIKESYGAAKQQHTFTVEVMWSKGVQRLPPLFPLLVKGRNLYRMRTFRQSWDNEAGRKEVLDEKHKRGAAARHVKNKVECFSCKNLGHIAANCTQKVCNYCKKQGHIIKECPIRPQNRQTSVFASEMVQQNIVSAFSALAIQDGGVPPQGSQQHITRPQISGVPVTQPQVPLSNQPLDLNALGVENAPDAAKPPPPSSVCLGQVPRGASASVYFKVGFAHFEQNQLPDALSCFDEAFLALAKDQSRGVDIKAQATICAQYKIAVTLLQEISQLQRVKGSSARSSKDEMARLSRHLSSLPLQEKHRTNCIRTAIKRNIEVHNFGYSKQMLELLLSKSPSSKQDELKSQVDMCVQRGYSNKSIDPLEDPSMFCGATLSCISTIGYDVCNLCGAKFSAHSTPGCIVCGMGSIKRSDALEGPSPFLDTGMSSTARLAPSSASQVDPPLMYSSRHQGPNNGNYASQGNSSRHQGPNSGNYASQGNSSRYQGPNYGNYDSHGNSSRHQDRNYGNYASQGNSSRHQGPNDGNYAFQGNSSRHQGPNYGNYASQGNFSRRQGPNDGNYASLGNSYRYLFSNDGNYFSQDNSSRHQDSNYGNYSSRDNSSRHHGPNYGNYASQSNSYGHQDSNYGNYSSRDNSSRHQGNFRNYY